jgi:hypothetical protein
MKDYVTCDLCDGSGSVLCDDCEGAGCHFCGMEGDFMCALCDGWGGLPADGVVNDEESEDE